MAREKERKERTTLLMALPEDHLAKFHKMADAKEMWGAIKSRFGSNDESKKMQKYLLKRRDVVYNGNKSKDNGRRPTYQDDSKALVTINGEDIDWSGHVEEDAQNYAMIAYSSSNLSSDNETSADESYSKPSEYASCESDSSVDTTTSMLEPVENTPKGICEPKVWTDAPINEECDSDSDDDSDDPHRALKDKGIIDSGCSRYMTGNKPHFVDYQKFKGGSVAFEGSNERITGKGKIKAGRKESNTSPLVRPRQSDNRTEFKNHELIELFVLKGIKREYSNARTPQQNGVAERMNMTLIEATRTMLADSFLPTKFWAEAVNTACYVLNRVLVTKPQNMTPYEILKGKPPIISYLRPFGYHVTILNTTDQFGKFYGKFDSRFLVGYSLNSKAFRVYDLETKRVNENLHDAHTNITSLLNAVSTPLSAAGPSRAFNDGELSYPDDPSMPHLEDMYASSSEGIFTDSSHDDEGVITDFSNLETTVNVSPTPTTRIHTIHPKTQILRDPMSAVQTKSIVNMNSEAHALEEKKDIMLVQVYVGDIIFSSTKKSWCDEFKELMKNRFQMSSMGELTFFLGLQVKQKEDGIFVSQDKYVAKILKKFGFLSVKTASTRIETQNPLVKDEEAADVDVHLYRFTPKASHIQAVKRIFRYLKGEPKLGLWYPKVSSFDLEAYSDSDSASANLFRKSTTGGCQFLSRRLILWQCKKQTIVATSTTKAEYVAAAHFCG
nr:uncharacterized mitochondrial protein AtMg00810-like [Tanacetum cinerariifolium]